MGSQLLPAVVGGAKGHLQKTFHLQAAAQLHFSVYRKVREANPLRFLFGTFSPGCAKQALRVQGLPIALVKAQVAGTAQRLEEDFSASGYDTLRDITPFWDTHTTSPRTLSPCGRLAESQVMPEWLQT